MKIFKKDMKDNLKSILIWTFSAGAMAFISVSIFDSLIASNMDEWNQMMQTMPQAFLDAFQISEYTFEDIMQFYAMEGYLYVSLLLGIFAALIGSKLINKEESEKTSEFMLAKPVSRINYITQKLLALFVAITIANTAVHIILYIGLLIGSKDPFSFVTFINYFFATYLLILAFGMISFTIACIARRKKGLTGISIGIVFLSFFIMIISQLSDKLTNFKYLSLFHYVNADQILDKGISILSIVVFFIIFGITKLISYKVYLKKDIYN